MSGVFTGKPASSQPKAMRMGRERLHNHSLTEVGWPPRSADVRRDAPAMRYYSRGRWANRGTTLARCDLMKEHGHGEHQGAESCWRASILGDGPSRVAQHALGIDRRLPR